MKFSSRGKKNAKRENRFFQILKRIILLVKRFELRHRCAKKKRGKWNVFSSKSTKSYSKKNFLKRFCCFWKRREFCRLKTRIHDNVCFLICKPKIGDFIEFAIKNKKKIKKSHILSRLMSRSKAPSSIIWIWLSINCLKMLSFCWSSTKRFCVRWWSDNNEHSDHKMNKLQVNFC